MKKLLLTISAFLSFGGLNAQTYEWVQQIGSTSTFNEVGVGTATYNNQVYLLTEFRDTIDADPGTSYLEMIATGNSYSDICIQKLNSDGSLVWAKKLGNQYSEYINSIDVDGVGNIYLTGSFTDTLDFDLGSGTSLQVAENPVSTFIAKYDQNWNLTWVRTMHLIGNFGYVNLELDASNNLYYSFIFNDSIDVNPDPLIDTYEVSTSNYRSIILKMDQNGNYQWHRAFGNNPGVANIHSIAVKNNSLYFTGEFGNDSIDIDPGTGTLFFTPIAVSWDAFYGEMNLNGELLWAKQAGGNGNEYMHDIRVDSFGNLIISGLYSGDMDFNYGGTPMILSHIASDDAFVFKCSPQGNPIWIVPIAGTNTQQPEALTLDQYDNIYISGMFESTVDLDPGTGTFNITSQGTYDGFIAKYGMGGEFLNGWAIGSSYWLERINGLSVDDENNLYASGRFSNSVTFNTTSGNVNLTSMGGLDALAVKLSCAPIETSVTYDINEFAAVETGALAYQWYDCSTGTAIPGETTSTYTATSILNVAVTLTMDNNGCVATSDCIDILGTDEMALESLSIYPNPSNGEFNIKAEDGIEKIAIYSIEGELVYASQLNGEELIKLNLQVQAGVYFITVQDMKGHAHRQQLIKN